MKIVRTVAPALVLTSLALTGCTTVKSEGGSSPSGAASTAPTTPAGSGSTQAPSEQNSIGSSGTTSSGTASTPSQDSSTSSSQTSSSVSLTASDIVGFADSHEIRSCVITNMAYVSSTQFCKEDASSINATYKGQRMYFTTAVKYKSSSSYSFEVSNGVQTRTAPLESKSGLNTDGQAVTLSVYVPMERSGTYSIKFRENGSQFASDSVNVTVP